MEHIVVDTNILVASFIEPDSQHLESQKYIAGLEDGSYIFHLPMLVIAEIIASISKRVTTNRLALLARTDQSLKAWEQSSKMTLYPLDRDRMDRSIRVAQRDRLRGADSVIAALAEELGMHLKTFDAEILGRFSQAST